jgi:hypothetical protein
MLIFKIQHYISKVSMCIFLFSALFLLQRFIIIHLIDINKFVLFNRIYLHEIVLSVTSILIIKKFFKISSPYAKYL